MDDRPLSGVVVQFYPGDGGNSSTGTTDDSGHYFLRYNAHQDGAKIGPHQVRVVMQIDEETGRPIGTFVPRIYGEGTALPAIVEDKDNSIDFALDSKAK